MFMSARSSSRLISRASSSSQLLLATPKARNSIPALFTAPASKMSYSDLKTPTNCYVDFCMVPIGTGSTSISREVAEVQKVLKASGLYYKMHSAGTTVEGPWDEVMKVVGQAHAAVHKTGATRIQSSMRVGSRTDKSQTADEKIKSVEDILARDEKK